MEQWRFINIEKVDPYTIMAINEAILRESKENTVFLWEIKKSIILGYFQRAEIELNLERCKGYPITRRLTGGGLAFADDRERQIHYGIVAEIDDDKIPLDVLSSYDKICSVVVRTLEDYGLKANFAPINDVLVDGKKISGNAQTRRENRLLQHGTLLLDFDVEEMLRISNIPLEKISDKAVSSVKERMTWLDRELGERVDIKEVKNAMKNKFIEVFDVDLRDDELTEDEEMLKEKLIPKYRSEEWIFKRKK